MTVAVGVLAALNVALLIWALWTLYKIREDLLTIRTLMAAQGNLAAWLAENPDRPYRDDPPIGKPK